MTKENEAAADVAAFDISSLDAVDESTLIIVVNGRATNWAWVFAGPGHPKAVEQANRMARERLKLEREQEQARINGRKWKAPEETPEGAVERNVAMVVDRLIGWHVIDAAGNKTGAPVLMAGEPFPFSEENARKVLSDRRRGSILLQALEFLGDEAAFTKRSAQG
jgi:hypothetical protein